MEAGESEAAAYLRLHSESEAGLGYSRPGFKNKTKRKRTLGHLYNSCRGLKSARPRAAKEFGKTGEALRKAVVAEGKD